MSRTLVACEIGPSGGSNFGWNFFSEPSRELKCLQIKVRNFRGDFRSNFREKFRDNFRVEFRTPCGPISERFSGRNFGTKFREEGLVAQKRDLA